MSPLNTTEVLVPRATDPGTMLVRVGAPSIVNPIESEPAPVVTSMVREPGPAPDPIVSVAVMLVVPLTTTLLTTLPRAA